MTGTYPGMATASTILRIPPDFFFRPLSISNDLVRFNKKFLTLQFEIFFLILQVSGLYLQKMHEIKDSGTTITVHLLVFICVLCFIYSNEIHISIVFCFFFFYFEKVKILGEPMPKFSILKTHRPLTTTLKRPLFRRRPPHPLSNREIIRLQSGRTTNDDRERTNAVRGLPAILTLVSNSAEKYQQRGPPPLTPQNISNLKFCQNKV